MKGMVTDIREKAKKDYKRGDIHAYPSKREPGKDMINLVVYGVLMTYYYRPSYGIDRGLVIQSK